MKPARLSVVDQELPEYPISREERLDGNSFVKWHTGRWLSSKTFKLMPWDMQGMARALFDLCQTESPVGSLPDDNEELAFMLRVDVRSVREFRGLEFGPLRNWVCCVSDGEVRLMHPVVVDVIRDALDRRALSVLSSEQKAVAVRLDRLRKALVAEGLTADVTEDPVLIDRMDDWLRANHKGNRGRSAYRSVILHASRQRWFGASIGGAG